ncbi:uncharacterized protein Z520_06525 [Fonsecaea multimorphosa CBS 102226]|uniref:Acyl-CoA dehydrogenase n=1 Tax=Fonsecaea multimorphosa CBS 102226 TaxID=1442371 RepID=A0A0D2JW66_9EURO|nr:uncharacterized protein Z520_06525 [Fonsecaea multimorphosa CBS 102226]KIX97747.1 hypothetical protein Z520_06525 [Fonsecaea multimorphosa CBS 102226]OAL23767.1 hypothetical protein AYO22_06086 [Fonsecaea multimorphosa]
MERFGSTIPYAEPAWYQSPNTSPFYNESHRQLRQYIRQYVEENLIPYAEEWEAAGGVPKEVFERHARLGFVAASIYPVAAEYLGAFGQYEAQTLPMGIPAHKWDLFHDFIMHDELSRVGYMGALWALNGGNTIGVPPIINFGTKEQKDRLLPKFLRGHLRACLGITEPDAGSDVSGIKTTATLSDDGQFFIVNGFKKWITNGLWCDYMVAAVRTGCEAARGTGDLSALIISLAAEGVTCRRLHNSGVSASGSTFVELDDVKVPRENLLGGSEGLGKGFRMVLSNFNHERFVIAVQSLRLSRLCFEDAYSYARRRETFGKPLLSNQIIRFKLGNMSMLIESIQAQLETLLYHASVVPGALDTTMGGDFARIKVHSARALELCVREAQQILGGLGYSRGGVGGRVEQISRDVRVMVVGGGSDEILTDLVIRQAMALEKTRARASGKL